MRQICIYPGRFQLFCPHHYLSYQYLCKKFGVDNVFIATSNNVNTDRNILNFNEKKRIIKNYGISDDKIIQTKNPYKPMEITDRFNPNDTILFIAYGEKDMGRFKTGSYFIHCIDSVTNPNTMAKNGYLYVLPTFRNSLIGVDFTSASEYRNLIPFLSKKEFEDVMGWYNENDYLMLKNKFFPNFASKQTNVLKSKQLTEIHNVRNASNRTHLYHPYEDEELNISELKNMFEMLFDNAIECYEKFDGINLRLGFRDGRIVAARNKTTIKNPMSIRELYTKMSYIDNNLAEIMYDIATSFDYVAYMRAQNAFQLEFAGEYTYLNIEILAGRNVHRYNNQLNVVLHSWIDYDENANEINRRKISKPVILYLKEHLPRPGIISEVLAPHQITLNHLPQNIQNKFFDFLNSLGLKNKISNLSENQFQMLKTQILAIGSKLLQNTDSYFTNHSDIERIRIDVENSLSKIESFPQDKKNKFLENWKLFKMLGSIPANLEGVVYVYNGKLYKLTGIFAPINQILGLLKYDK